MSLLAITKNKY